MTTAELNGRQVVIVAGTSGIGRQLAQDAVDQGAQVTITGRSDDAVRAVAESIEGSVATAVVDLSNEESIAELATELARRDVVVDHLISLANAPAKGPVEKLEREAITRAFDAKVIGALLLVKHLRPTASVTLFSGIVAWRPRPGMAVTATTNGAVAFLAQALALELAPVRVNAVSPGIVDSGAWDGMGADKDKLFADVAAKNPARRIGTTQDISTAVLSAITNPFLTGTVLHLDGGARLV
ncbi:SDR family oxidoreductase [Kribbella catacumbae]|uniref:SDR family oxidoreductase n=1 Tax=Kribbella catacumbae TaxID=460086 RepID=UPI0003617C2F|nr:SDR family oxidoreductase [Kribbella catacumbae]